MGCFWSNEEREYCKHCNRKAVNNLVIIGHECEICINQITHTNYYESGGGGDHFSSGDPPARVQNYSKKNNIKISTGPKFGEYRCNRCRCYWSSYTCWPNKYQMCKRCHVPVMPYKYRDLCNADFVRLGDEKREHARELCQMCQQLGYPCSNFGKNKQPNRGKANFKRRL